MYGLIETDQLIYHSSKFHTEMGNLRLMVYGAKRHFQLYFSYIVAVIFIGGVIRSTT
jgi:hypothetical protein